MVLRYFVIVILAVFSGCGYEAFPQVRYLILGDSHTGDFSGETFPKYLLRELNLDQEVFIAEGAGGRTTEEGLTQLQLITQHDVYPNLETFIYYLGGADVVGFISSRDPGVAVSPGEDAYPYTNELAELMSKIRASLEDSVELALSKDWKIFLATYPALPVGVEPCGVFGNALNEIEASRANEYVDMLNDLIAETAEDQGVDLVDVRLDNEELVEDLNNFADCIHPNGLGAQIIARRFAETLNKLN